MGCARLPLFWSWVLALATACVFDPKIPDARVLCQRAADCPRGYTCEEAGAPTLRGVHVCCKDKDCTQALTPDQVINLARAADAAGPSAEVNGDAASAEALADAPMAPTSTDGPTANDGGAPLGSPCQTGGGCASGICASGVCCDLACDQACQTCNADGRPGTCTVVTGAPPAGRCPGGSGVCAPRCDGASPACVYPGATTACGQPSCADGVASVPAGCDGKGACAPAVAVPCAPFSCLGSTCAGGCDSDASCLSGFCAGGRCFPRNANGAACDRGAQCASGHCVVGVCCDGACTGACESCLDGPMKGQCGRRPRGTTCAPASACAGAGYTPASTCDAAGTCVAPAAVSCAPGACASSACLGPLQLPEAAQLQLWLIADDYNAGAWPDRSGKGHDATCTRCPSKVAGPAGHAALSFVGTPGLDDPSGGQWLDINNANFDDFSTGLTLAIAFRPLAPSYAVARVLELDSTINNRTRISFIHGVGSDLYYQVCQPDASCPTTAVEGWFEGQWLNTVVVQRLPSAVQFLQNGQNPRRTHDDVFPVPHRTERRHNRIGAGSRNGVAYGPTFNGEMLEIMIFKTGVSADSAQKLSQYLAAKYGL